MAFGDPRAEAIKRIAARIGANPVDLATVISFESAGTFSPSIYGGKGGKHLGLIQFGPNEQKTYGVNPKQTFDQQMDAVGQYLVSRGYKPGMDRTQLYSTILAGNPSRMNVSDTAAGGTPGGAAQKVATQMAGHEAKARALLSEPPLPPSRPSGAAPAIPTLPENPARGLLADNPMQKVANNVQTSQMADALQAAQLAAASQAAATPPPAPEPEPAPPPPPPALPPDYTSLLLPRLRRGLLASPDSYGMLGAT
jgi:hypothetical protein